MLLLYLLSLLSLPGLALAHESKPCLLNLRQLDETTYEVSWRTPPGTGGAYPVRLALPDDWTLLGSPLERRLADSDILLQKVSVPDGNVNGSVVSFPGLQGIITEVFVRVTRLDGTQFSAVVRSTHPLVVLRGQRSWWETASEFTALGVQHILLGIDHLLFVLGLLLIVRSKRALLKTITAFTLAHSITLAIAALGLAQVPGGPVEASIALSILLLAPEVLRVEQGQSSLTIRYPWLVAFIFGLLHGFGFASGLSLAGIPQAQIPLGLLSFNIGVELGQLLFVAAVLAFLALARALKLHWPRRLAWVPAYGIGIAAAYWFIQRSYQIIAG